MNGSKPEERARAQIDELLTRTGWVVQDWDEMNLAAGRGVAVREFRMAKGHGFADYLLFVDSQAVGALEAKPVGHTLSGVEKQSAKYSLGLPKEARHRAARTHPRRARSLREKVHQARGHPTLHPQTRASPVDGDVDALQGLFNKDVILQGMAVYRPSGALLRIDATLVTAGSDPVGLFARVPGPLERRSDAQSLRRSLSGQNQLATALGNWPGNESDEELLAALESLR